MKSIIISHKGKRKINQDLTLVRYINADTVLYLIADGMGGYDSGDIAASIAIDSVSTFLSNSTELNEIAIQKAINKANLAVRQYQEKHNSKLGSTLGGIIVSRKIAKAFWVGDVKILQYCDGKLSFESKSHNLQNEISDTQDFNNNSKFSKYEHIVTRSIQGEVKKSKPSYKEFSLKKEDILFLCSDGVHNIIDAQTLQYMIKEEDSEMSLSDLLNERIAKEATDNASLIMINHFDI
ncbi:protein phosphatase [Salinimicrobium marinum]|uniref:Protein phosphatase n=1 Tax=Salinimicrobium marinum TaxID=680283 RepID=A0A918SH38_9FLAO|nr:protein phosphatase 2C domain-containing protein [Salinimicrobium marinum]GHA38227.1 protein phosphatase [Salinimicrobium marinum]